VNTTCYDASSSVLFYRVVNNILEYYSQVKRTVGALAPRATAAAWNLSKVFPESGALMLPTIPWAQCVGALQWNQMAKKHSASDIYFAKEAKGLYVRWESVMLMEKVEPVVTKSESKPAGALALALASKCVQGSWNVDWVTEWGNGLLQGL